jgi:hypothetical protein
MPKVIASTFADPTDVKAYRDAIAAGDTPEEALKVGDNGIGCWGDDTTSDVVPMCALPPEDWEAKWGRGNAARGAKVAVTYLGVKVIGELRDTMPNKWHRHNGAGIDLNPGFCKAFGLAPGFLLPDFEWEWA